MSLLKDLLMNEQAATGSTGAGAVANARGSLFGGGPVDLKAENRRKTKMMRRIGYVPVSEVITPRQSNTWKAVYEAASSQATFDEQDVISKLDAAEQKAKASQDVVAFGMEDEDGKIVKVYVRSEQADDFEVALAQALAGADGDDNDENTSAEIAEVLYQLKDKFDIVDVEWGVIIGDEDEEQEIEGDDPEAEMDVDAEGEGGELDVDADVDVDATVDDTTDQAASALQAVIDVMKADAEAREAEAQAKKAEADAETAKYAAQASAAKVAQEEQILDMEAAEKAEKEAEKEAKQLAKLAKYQHKQKADQPDATVSKTIATDDAVATQTAEIDVENEEQGAENISQDELASLLLKHMSGKK